MKQVYISLGSNLGNRHQNLIDAIANISNYAGKVVKQSSVYETTPWGMKDQPDFLNQVICVETNLSPASLLSELLAVERLMGRTRAGGQKWGPRTIDVDILLFDNLIVNEDNVQIPHPRMHERMFVLAPLVELTPQLKHPVLNKTISELKDLCTDNQLAALIASNS